MQCEHTQNASELAFQIYYIDVTPEIQCHREEAWHRTCLCTSTQYGSQCISRESLSQQPGDIRCQTLDDQAAFTSSQWSLMLPAGYLKQKGAHFLSSISWGTQLASRHSAIDAAKELSAWLQKPWQNCTQVLSLSYWLGRHSLLECVDSYRKTHSVWNMIK